ncbi:u6 snRNA-associated sm family protein lsm2 [Cyclospora cayetanensis]|uniref:U6 snRNA-associated sm family protein lsm2 n=1 Tax=Cyclospora cayetanensis TaxID=88456 RepID=A0A1D3D2X1_9EIME|nr:u6 snRNA-associated sm family protein lsm2 [Cyclospora cayetanensis]
MIYDIFVNVSAPFVISAYSPFDTQDLQGRGVMVYDITYGAFYFGFFQRLTERNCEIMVELKNDLQLTGTLHSVDQFLNIKLNQVSVSDPDRCPHLLSVRSCFIRGSAVRYVHLQPADVDLAALRDLCREENRAAQESKQKGA